jgi:opine dehydrogenase
MNAMKIAVLGGGNGAHTVAADLTLKGLSVNMFEIEQFASAMQTVFDTGEIEMTGVAGQGKAKLNLVTTDLAAAIRDVEVIFIILPGFTIATYAKLLAPHLSENQMVIIMPGTLAALEFRQTLRASGNFKEILTAEVGGLPAGGCARQPGPGCFREDNGFISLCPERNRHRNRNGAPDPPAAPCRLPAERRSHRALPRRVLHV